MTYDRIMKPSTEVVPLYRTGHYHLDRHFAGPQLAEIDADPELRESIEGELLRRAYREAANQSLTVLSEVHKGWTDAGNHGRIYGIRLAVIHEPQTDDKLIYQVAARLYRDPDLWDQGPGVIPSEVAIARAALLAVRDLGRLTASAPRPGGVTE